MFAPQQLPMTTPLRYLACLLVLSIGACTENDTPSTLQPNAHATQDFTGAASKPISQKEQGSDQVSRPDERKSNEQLSGISFMQADTDGDRVLDAVEICRNNKVCIARGRTNEQIVYSEPAWVGVRILDVQDTDGRDGAEVIIQALDSEGNLLCLCVVRDANRSITTYQDGGWKSIVVQVVEDTDGLSGKEIVLLAKDPLGSLRCICIIHDRNGDIHYYHDWEWSSVKSLWPADTDGKPGMELVLEIQNGQDNLQCVCIIHDTTQQFTKYSNSSWIDGQVALLTDTDGQTGVDIVFGYRASFGSGIDVIHDRSGTIRTYPFRGELPSIEHVRPSSHHPGNDLCVLVGRDELVLLTERQLDPVSVSSCEQSPSQPSLTSTDMEGQRSGSSV